MEDVEDGEDGEDGEDDGYDDNGEKQKEVDD